MMMAAVNGVAPPTRLKLLLSPMSDQATNPKLLPPPEDSTSSKSITIDSTTIKLDELGLMVVNNDGA